MLSSLPAQYAKAIASAVTMLVTYITAYGATWHLLPAILAIASILGVGAVPNTSKPVAASPQPAQQPQAAQPVVVNLPPGMLPPGGLPPRT